MASRNPFISAWEDWERNRKRARPEQPEELATEVAAPPAKLPEEPAEAAAPDVAEPAADVAEPAAESARQPGARQHKRRAKRVATTRFVRLHGRLGSYRAIVVNLSRTGVLLTITDSNFQLSATEVREGLAGLRVASHFGEHLGIEFLDADFEAAAEVIRISEDVHESGVAISMGCRFERELDADECELLGVPFEDECEADGDETDGPAFVLEEEAPVAEGAPQAPVVVVPASAADLRAARKPRVRLPRSARLWHDRPPVGIMDLLELAVERGATDLHFKGGSPVRLRADGHLMPVSETKLRPDEAAGLIRDLLADEQWERFEEDGDLDAAFTLEGKARFRLNALKAQGVMGMAIRRIPDIVPTVDELGLAPVCTKLAEKPRGLVLVTGPTGSGKSTTLAAMIDHVNESRDCHILTMEDPIEYIHREKLACITQREIGRDTKDFASALRRALRQDPDVILVGEMRDLETISLAVTAAETGHLVFGTLHTTSAVLTVDRVIDVFPPEQQRQIRMQLSDALQGVISQVLLPRRGRGVVVAQEILIASGGVRALIREGKAPQIANMMQTGAKEGMQTLEDSLNDLIAKGHVSYEVALHKAHHPRQITHDGKLLNRR